MPACPSTSAKNFTPPPLLRELVAKVKASGGPPGAVIISCCDPRLNPFEYLGLDETIWPVVSIRNAGGRVLDTERSIAIFQLVGQPTSIIIVHHTGESSALNRPDTFNRRILSATAD